MLLLHVILATLWLLKDVECLHAWYTLLIYSWDTRTQNLYNITGTYMSAKSSTKCTQRIELAKVGSRSQLSNIHQSTLVLCKENPGHAHALVPHRILIN